MAPLTRLLLRTSPALLIIAAVIGLASGFSSAAMIALISQSLTAGGTVTLSFLASFTGLLLLVMILDLTSKQLLVRIAARTNYDLSLWLTNRVLATPLRTLEETGAARILAALTDDLALIGTALSQAPNVLVNSAILLGCSVYLLWLSPLAFVLLSIVVVPAVAVQALFHRRAKSALRTAYASRDRLFRLFRTITEGFKDLKLHASRRYAFWSQLLAPAAEAYRNSMVTGRGYYSLSTTWGQTVFFLFVLGLFLLSAVAQPDIRVLTGYALVALYMRGSMNALLAAIPFMGNASLALERVEALGLSLASDSVVASSQSQDSFDDAGEPDESISPKPLTITLAGVKHTYRTEGEDRDFTLGPLDLELRSGELVFLTGANGSGKTTLVKLLTGLYLPEAGDVLWDGVRVTSANVEAYRRNFSAIFADSFVFEDLLGVSEGTLDLRVREYLEMLQLERKVSISDGRLSTTDLSSGQRSRLSLMLAYLEDSPVYVFDEWAAGQDPDFKRLFYQTFLCELRDRGKLVIVITHDDQYYHLADRIVKMDYGRIERDSRQGAAQAESQRQFYSGHDV